MQKNKALISIVIILGLIIIVGLGALVFGLYQRANDPDFNFFKQDSKKQNFAKETTTNIRERNIKSRKNISIPLGKNEWVSNIATSQNNIIVYITNKFKDSRLLILDADDGSIIRHVEFKNSQ